MMGVKKTVQPSELERVWSGGRGDYEEEPSRIARTFRYRFLGGGAIWRNGFLVGGGGKKKSTSTGNLHALEHWEEQGKTRKTKKKYMYEKREEKKL